MSSELPPRVVPASTFAPSVSSPIAPARIPPKRSRTLLIVVLVVLGFVGLFGGGGFYVLSTLRVANSPAREASRTPFDTRLPIELVQSLSASDSVPVSNNEIAEIETFLVDATDAKDAVDRRYFAWAMQATKLRPVANSLTSRLIAEAISKDLVLPNISETCRVVHIDWIKPKTEARAVVTSFEVYSDEPMMYLVWVVKGSDGEWKLYDWKEFGHHETEAEYYALALQVPEAKQSAFGDLGVELQATHAQPRGPNSDPGEAYEAVYRSHPQPSQFQSISRLLMADFYAAIGDHRRLKAIVSELDSDTVPIVHYYLAKAHTDAGEADAAIAHVKELLTNVGWHPAAATLVAAVARSDEEKSWAAALLSRNLCLAPNHTPSVNAFTELASESEFERLVQQLKSAKISLDQTLALAEIIRYRAEALTRLASALRAADFHTSVAELIDLRKRTEAGKDLNAFAELLELSRLEGIECVRAAAEKELFSSIVGNPVALTNVMAAFDDKTDFLRRVRDRALQNFEPTACFNALRGATDGLGMAAAEFLAEPTTQAVWTQIDYERKDYASAMQRGMSLDVDSAFEPIDEESYRLTDGEIAYPSLVRAAAKLGRLKEVLEHFEHTHYGMPMVMSAIDPRLDSQMFDAMLAAHAEQMAEQGIEKDVWQTYYSALAASRDGNWREADELLVSAMQQCQNDELLSDYYLPPEFSTFLSIEESLLGEWTRTRFRLARVHGHLSDLIAAETSRIKRDAEQQGVQGYADDTVSHEQLDAYQLSMEVSDSDDLELRKAIAELLVADAQQPQLQARGHKILSENHARRREFAEAVKQIAIATKLEADAGSYASQASAINMMRLAVQSGDRTTKQTVLAELADSDSKWLKRFYPLFARQDRPGILELFKDKSEAEVLNSLISNQLLREDLRKIDVLQSLEESVQISTHQLQPTAEVLLLSREEKLEAIDFSDVIDNVSSSLGSSLGTPTRAELSTDRISNTHWATQYKFPSGILVVASLIEPATHLESSVYLPRDCALRAQLKGALVLQWYATSDQTMNHAILHRLSKDYVGREPSVMAFADVTRSAMLSEAGWRDRLSESKDECFSYLDVEAYGDWRYSSEPIDQDPSVPTETKKAIEANRTQISFGLLNEWLFITKLEKRDSSYFMPVQLSEDCMLSPNLQTGDRLEIYDN